MSLNRSLKPDTKGKILLRFPEIERFSLKCGLNVLFVKKTELPLVQFSFITGTGSKADPKGKEGLAYLTSLLIDEGAGGLTALELDEAIESLGTVLNIACDHDSIFIRMLCLRDCLEDSLRLYSDIITRPHFDDLDFEREKKRVLTSLLQLKDEAGYISASVFEKKVFESTGYEHPTVGYEKSLRVIANADVRKFYENEFSPLDSTLVAVGAVNKEELATMLETCFSEWAKELKPREAPMPIRIPGKGGCYFINKDEAEQTVLSMGNLCSGRQGPAFFWRKVLNNIAGGQFSSRINQNLRENKGYTYGASSSFNYNKRCGYFSISTSVKSEITGNAIKEILSELKGLSKISDSEISFSKSYLIKRYPLVFETYSQVASQLSTLAVHGLPYDYFGSYLGNLESVSGQNLKEAMETSIFPENLVVVAVGKREAALKDLGAIFGRVQELNFEGEPI